MRQTSQDFEIPLILQPIDIMELLSNY